jgi:transposase
MQMGAPTRIQVLEHADQFFGIDGVRIDRVIETYDSVRCIGRVLAANRPVCLQCSDKRQPRIHDYIAYEVADTPSRGRQTVLVLEVPRYRHRCGATIDAKRPKFLHPDLPATRRLIRYVEGQTFRRPVLDIAREVGMDEPDVRNLAAVLAHRLRTWHRFPVPAVLGIDDLHIRKKLFTVVTDGSTGHAIALIPGAKFEDVRDELLKRRKMDLGQVRCIVSDMSGSNIKVATKLFKRLPAVHVADKWHVLRYVQKALSRVVSQEVDRLQKPPKGTTPNDVATMAAQAATIRAVRKRLMSGRVATSGERQGELDLDGVGSVLANHKRIGIAFWAKIRLHQAYAAPNRAEAIRRAWWFVRRARHPSVIKEMMDTLKHLWRRRKPILNYWEARWPDGSLIRPTTGPTERRNGSIRKIWRSAHGFRHHPLFELRALYEPWKLDVDILPCAEPGCCAVDGPGIRPSRRYAVAQDAADIRCSAHAK